MMQPVREQFGIRVLVLFGKVRQDMAEGCKGGGERERMRRRENLFIMIIGVSKHRGESRILN